MDPSSSPIVNVRGSDDTERTAGVDESPGEILVTGLHDGFFVCFGSTGFDGGDEAGTDPYGLSSPSEVGSQTPAVIYGASTDNVDGLSGKRRSVALASIDDGRDKD